MSQMNPFGTTRPLDYSADRGGDVAVRNFFNIVYAWMAAGLALVLAGATAQDRGDKVPKAQNLGALVVDSPGAEPGFVSLFNGTDLTGWKVPEGDNGHWKVVDGVIDYDARSEAKGAKDLVSEKEFGNFECLPVELAPRKAVRLALKAADLIGDGLYGVDIKQSGDRFYVIEVNDNPSIDAGVEDEVLRDELYRRIMAVFLARIEQKKAGFVPT